jgi:RimJ/RimL family protein N-acetyltransferase
MYRRRIDIPKIYFQDIFCKPVTEENIDLGWLEWSKNTKVTSNLAGDVDTNTREDLKKYLNTLKTSQEETILFLACYTSQKEYFGNLRIYKIGNNAISFGRLIGNSKLHGLGLGTKMSLLALSLAFDYLNTDLVVVGNKKDNIASAKSKIKSGFLKAEKKLLDKEGISGLKDEEFYYLTKEKYLN